MKAHFGTQTKRCGFHFQVSRCLKEQDGVRLLLAGRINQGLGGLDLARRNCHALDYLFWAGDKRGFRRGKKRIGRMRSKRENKPKVKQK